LPLIIKRLVGMHRYGDRFDELGNRVAHFLYGFWREVDPRLPTKATPL
jgi:hypothetical protein